VKGNTCHALGVLVWELTCARSYRFCWCRAELEGTLSTQRARLDKYRESVTRGIPF
jgi:hypothetical protein